MRSWWPIPALLGAALLFAAFDTDSGLRTWWRLRADLGAAEARLAGLSEAVGTRREAAASLEADAFAIERAIRERLEYARPGEVLVRIAPEQVNSRIR